MSVDIGSTLVRVTVTSSFFVRRVGLRARRTFLRLIGRCNHVYLWSAVKASKMGGPRAKCYLCGR